VVVAFKVLSRIFLEGLRKTTKHLSQDSGPPCRDLNPDPPEYEAGVLTVWPGHSVYLLNQLI
jgi:hypothetical protein